MISSEQGSRDKRRWSACDDRGELVAEAGTAVAQPWRERFRDQGCLRAVQIHDGEQGQRDRDKHPNGGSSVEQREVNEAKCSTDRGGNHVFASAADAIR